MSSNDIAAHAAAEVVDVTGEVATLDEVAANDEQKAASKTAAAATAVDTSTDMGQSKKEDIDTYPSRR